jgi:hypothetical protein
MFEFFFADKRRKMELRRTAEVMNLQYSETADKSFAALYKEFRLFSQGYARRFANLLRGEFQQVSTSLFDYRYTTGSGDSTHTARQTVVVFDSPRLKLPGFYLRPENLIDKIGEVFGRKDINFAPFPRFSKQYFLRSADEEAARRLFSDWVLSYFEQHPGLCCEGRADRLIFYRAGKPVAPEKIEQFLQDGLEVFNLFKEG